MKRVKRSEMSLTLANLRVNGLEEAVDDLVHRRLPDPHRVHVGVGDALEDRLDAADAVGVAARLAEAVPQNDRRGAICDAQ